MKVFLNYTSDRDLQCDFDNEFWEESKCSWRYSQSTLTFLSLGTASRLQRVGESDTPDTTDTPDTPTPSVGKQNYFKHIVGMFINF